MYNPNLRGIHGEGEQHGSWATFSPLHEGFLHCTTHTILPYVRFIYRKALFLSPNVENRVQLAKAISWGKDTLVKMKALTPEFRPSYATLSEKGLIPGDCQVTARDCQIYLCCLLHTHP